MPSHREVPSLYYYSLQATFEAIRHVRPEPLAGLSKELPLDAFPSHVVTDLMEVAYLRKGEYQEQNKRILFTPTARKVIMDWSLGDFEIITARCPNVREIIAFVVDEIYGLGRDMKFIAGSPLAKRIIFLKTAKKKHRSSFKLKHSALGRQPTIYTCLSRQTEGDLFAKSPLVREEGVDRTVEFHLQCLDLQVTDIQAILRSCPHVRVLRNSSLVEALYSLNSDEKEKPRYKLKNLDMTVVWLENPTEAVKFCVETCPEVSMVDFSLRGGIPLDELENPLSSLAGLEDLRISGLKESATTVDSLYSVIDNRGGNLRHLRTEIPRGLDVVRILNACPNLRCLHLCDSWSTNYSVPDLSKENLPNLVEVKLSGEFSFTDNPPSTLSNLLLSKHLAIIKLSTIRVDEDVLDTTMQNGYWPNLTEFYADYCMNLKSNHVMNLLRSDNKLLRLDIVQCDNVSYNEVTKCIKELSPNVYYNAASWGWGLLQ